MVSVLVFVVLGLTAASAFPTDEIIAKYNHDGPRFQHVADADGNLHLADLWLKNSDLVKAARFTPDTTNVYHLFTRNNPSVSQPMLLGTTSLLTASNFDASKRTVFIIHGWLNSATSTVNALLVPAFLTAEDVNVFVVDWSVGAADADYMVAAVNTVTSGESVARFVNWLSMSTGSTPSQYHISGHSLGGQQAGIVGRNVDGDIDYITSLDPAGPAWEDNPNRFQPNDGTYTEVIHTNAGVYGFTEELGQVDFYPNGGANMAGCANDDGCNHDRSTGIYYMATNDGPPFSQN